MKTEKFIEVELKSLKTLFFSLETTEDKYSFNANEILEQIQNQRANFIKEHNYKPEYISIPDDINNFLFEQLILKKGVIDIDQHEDYSPKTIYGMIVESYFIKNNILGDKIEKIEKY